MMLKIISLYRPPAGMEMRNKSMYNINSSTAAVFERKVGAGLVVVEVGR
jgi:hypothetical protein